MPVGPFARLICHVCCFLYPAYASYKVLSSPYPATQHAQQPGQGAPTTTTSPDEGLERWLMYWTVIGTWTAVESTVGWIFTWIPFYSVFKLLVFLYFSLPQSQGSTLVYQRVLAPIFAEHERDIDSLLVNLRTQSTSALSDGLGYAWNKVAQQISSNAAPPGFRNEDPSRPLSGHEQYPAPAAPPPSFQDPAGGAAQKLYGFIGRYAGQYLPVAATALQAAAAAASGQNTISRSQAQAQAQFVQETLNMPVPQPTPGVGGSGSVGGSAGGSAGGSRAMQYASLGETSARSQNASAAGLHPRSISSSSSHQNQPQQPQSVHSYSSDSIQSRSSRSSFSGLGGYGSGIGIGGSQQPGESSYVNISSDEIPHDGGLGGTGAGFGSGYDVGSGQAGIGSGNGIQMQKRPDDKRRTSWFGRSFSGGSGSGSGAQDKDGKAE